MKHLSKTDAQLDIWIFSGPETELGMRGDGVISRQNHGQIFHQELLRGRVHAELTAAAQVGLLSLKKNLLHP